LGIGSEVSALRLLDFDLINHSSRRRRSSPSAIKTISLFLLFVVLSALLTGCQTTKQPQMKGVMLSYNTLKTILGNYLPGGIREQSSNGRTLYSGYFPPGRMDDDGLEENVRAYGVVTILGTSRPYNIDVNVIRERKTGDDYKSEGSDKALTKQLAERLRRALADRREDRNVIDDFRAF
jgi:hypothetical protein